MFGKKSKGGNTVNTSMSPRCSVKLVQDSSGTPAVSLAKVESAGSVDLTKRFQKAGISLSKRNLAGIRAQAVLVLDHSGSMHNDYNNGTVQQLVERALGFALNIDADGTIPVIPFDSRVHPTVDVTLQNYHGVVDREIWKPSNMGSTDLARALEVVKDMVVKSDSPVYCVIVTDGSPDDRVTTSRIVCELAAYPVFMKFLAIREVPYLNELDDLPDSQRLLDNVDAQAITDPAGMSDLAFADAMTEEWDSWIELAKSAGVLLV
jgi:hypothetical protein